MSNNLLALVKLTRIGLPTGYLLCFFPACYGLVLASVDLYWLKFVPLFLVGSVIARSAGCIINDVFDRDYDLHVNRTKTRPLASGEVSTKSAIIGLALISIVGINIILCLSKLAIYLCLIAILMIILYPLMKRITYFPQIFLGFTFNMGVLIAYTNIKNYISAESLIMYLSCCFWTIGFDTIYGFADTEDDEKIGIKSLSILLKYRKYKYYISFFYVTFIGLFYFAIWLTDGNIVNNTGFNLCIFISMTLLLYQPWVLNIANSDNCITIFKLNNYIGFILLIAIAMVKYQIAL
ncbi:MAG: 4-hydroxybenzoate octaprenyltransferase [Rickettsiaceae bacterium]|nr:MAG: 4-hydroxybenzoate octaprenyltransferase [Rickettsiaceae bacterium]